jgi:hypothetical protein
LGLAANGQAWCGTFFLFFLFLLFFYFFLGTNTVTHSLTTYELPLSLLQKKKKKKEEKEPFAYAALVMHQSLRRLCSVNQMEVPIKAIKKGTKWATTKQIRDFLDEMSRSMNFTSMDEWYNVKKADIIARGGSYMKCVTDLPLAHDLQRLYARWQIAH